MKRTYACGLNSDNQIISYVDSVIICCLKKISRPTTARIREEKLVSDVKISISRIFWKEGMSWIRTGYSGINDDKEDLSTLTTAKRLSVSNNRLSVISVDGSVHVRDKHKWHRTILQCHPLGDDDEDQREAKDIATEDHRLLILDTHGRLFESGIELPLPGIKIVKIAVGKEHCLALSETYEVYSWGSGMRGQLGNGSIDQTDNPETLQSLHGIFIIDIKCGGWHSAALSREGDAYMWGWNDVGQLGFPSKGLRSEGIKWHVLSGLESHRCCCKMTELNEVTSHESPHQRHLTSLEVKLKMDSMLNDDMSLECINVQTTPRLLDYWKVDYSVKEVALGDRHSVFLLEDGSAWTVGWNKYGQLGISSTECKDEPQLLSLFPVSRIFAGGWNTVVQQDLQDT